MEYNYSEIVLNGVKNRGNVFKLPDNTSNIDLDYYGKETIDSYHSAFLHSQELKLYSEIHGNIKGYKGKVFSKCLFWDLDSYNHDLVRKDTIELTERLLQFNPQNLRIYFSGNKGFHIIYLCPELINLQDNDNFNYKVQILCSNIAQGLSTFDPKIYDKTRIIRTLNSKHSKTNLYKIEITYNELNSLSQKELFELASKQRKSEKIVYKEQFDDNIIRLLNNLSVEKTINKRGQFNVDEILNGIRFGFDLGNRNSGFATIAGMLHRRNIDQNFIEVILQTINQNNKVPLSEQEITQIVNSINRYPVDVEYTDMEEDDIIDIESAGESWYQIIETSGYTNFGERFKHLNDRLKMVIPGDTIAFVANSGLGKTTMGMELGNNEAKSRNVYSLMASLEMSRAGIFFRGATIEATDLSIENYVPSSEVAKKLLNDSTLKNKVYDVWKNLKIIDKGGISLDKIIEYFNIAQIKYNNKIGNLIIDYAQNIKDSEKIDYSMMMARKFKEIAKSLNTKLFILMQCNKTIPDDYTEVQKSHIEGAGAYSQAMD
jgi:replicative DNA helicase